MDKNREIESIISKWKALMPTPIPYKNPYEDLSRLPDCDLQTIYDSLEATKGIKIINGRPRRKLG